MKEELYILFQMVMNRSKKGYNKIFLRMRAAHRKNLPLYNLIMNKLLLLFLISFFTVFGLPRELTADSQTSQSIGAKKSFKGWELYSWRNQQSNTWNFSLLQGTNRNKTEEEIKSSKATKDIDSLKAELKEIAPNESVSWLLNGAKGLEYPPEVIVDEIIAIGKKNGFNIAK